MVKIIDGIKQGIGIVLVLSIFVFGFYLVKGWNGLQATDGDTLTAAKWNELTNKVTNLESQIASVSPKECPSGFVKVEKNGNALGCIQIAENVSANGYSAIQYCFDNYGGRLPSWNERYIGANNYELDTETDGFEWIDNLVGENTVGSTTEYHRSSAAVVGGGYLTKITRNYQNSSSYGFRCWIDL